jgi:transposase-like protein
MAKKGPKRQSFSNEFKLNAVKMYESGMSMREVAKQLGLYDHAYIRRWVRNFRENGQVARQARLNGERGRINLGKASAKKPELRIKWLEAEVAYLKKAIAWERGRAQRKSDGPLSKN